MTAVDDTDGPDLPVAVVEQNPTTRRSLLRLGVGAAAGAAGAAALGGLAATPAGATAVETPVEIGQANTGTGVPTSLADSTFRAALQDWGGQVFNVRAYGAAGNGTTDDTSAISAALSAAGAGCVYFPKGTYLVSGLEVVTAGQSLKIEAGATLLATAGITKPVVTVTAVGVAILGPGTIDGNITGQTGTLTGLDGIRFSTGGDDGLVEGLVVQGAAWIGIEGAGANRLKVALSRILDCGHGGIASSATSAAIAGPTVIGNSVLLAGTATLTGINVQGANATHVVNYPTIVGNTVDVAAGIGYQASFCQYGRVNDNRGQAPGQVFSVSGGTDNVVSGNTAQATGNGAGIELGANYSTCIGNTVVQTGTGAGIHADNGAGTHVVISGNKITGAHTCGIGVGSYDHVTITGNVIHQSTTASVDYSVIQVSPAGPGLVVIGDNVCDGAGASGYGIWVDNLISAAVQMTIHDNAITGIPTGSSYAAFRFAGAGTVTDLLLHDNTVASGIPLYTTAAGLTFGNNVRFNDNIVVGGSEAGVSPVTLPASGTPYTNPGPYTEIVYVQGGKLTTTGSNQGVMKNGHALVPATATLQTPVAVMLYPGESLTVYYSSVPTARKDVKS